MSENPEEQAKERSLFFAEFESLGSVNIIGMEAKMVTPLQLLALSGYLEVTAKNQLLQEHRDQEENQILVASQPQIDLNKLR